MKLSTLNYIHELLTENVASETKAFEIVRDAFHTAEEDEASNLEELREMYGKVRKSKWDAIEALNDFESKEW